MAEKVDTATESSLQEVAALLNDLGIAAEYPATRGLLFYAQARIESLQVVELDYTGRPMVLAHPAAKAWKAMQTAAQNDGVAIVAFSAFRSYQYQAYLIRQELKKGTPLETILSRLAVPGYSEHHTGCAVDIHMHGDKPLLADFAVTAGYRWLQKHAQEFGFVMSYPEGNDLGYIFEPWHWCYHDSGNAL